MPARSPGLDPRRWPTSDPAEIVEFFARQRKHVVYIAGYGELGYQDASVVRRTVEDVLRERPASQVLAHVGTLLRTDGEDGIAVAIAVAKDLGVVTTGVHPSVAARFHPTHRVSPHCDHVFFVEDGSWGGRTPAGTNSPTLDVRIRVSHELVMVGGGRHAAQELRAFAEAGTPVRYVPAAMNSRAAQGWCRRAGIPDLDPRGEAARVWDELRGTPGAEPSN